MLLAIDAGNTHVVFGLWDGRNWVAQWRRATNRSETEDQLASWLSQLFQMSGIEWRVDAAVCGSVVPELDTALALMCERWLHTTLQFIRASQNLGLVVDYSPVSAVGADRIANALGALAKYRAPVVVVDFGTATTFDVIGTTGAYIGGAIMPGVSVSSEALFALASKLPSISLEAPETAIGKSTVHSLQAGIVLGYAEAIDGMNGRISVELGVPPTIISTGGLGKMFVNLCRSVSIYEPALTLDGLRIGLDRLTSGQS